MRATLVSHANVGLVWHEIEHYLDSAFATELSDDDPAEVKREVFSGRAQLWVVHDRGQIKAAGITRISKDICFCVALGGEDLADWVDILDREACLFAREYKCKRIRVTGRPGWKKIMKPLGYKEPFVIIEKAL